MANGTIAFDTLSTSGQITGTAKSLDTDYVVSGSAKSWAAGDNSSGSTVTDSLNVASLIDQFSASGPILMASISSWFSPDFSPISTCCPHS